MSKADKLLKRIEFYDKMASSQKPEADALLKKAALFERLALYSDRKSFLQAVAQAAPPGLDAQTKQLLYRASQILQGAGVDATAVGNAITFNRVDFPAIKKSINDALLTGKISPLSNEYKELQSISQNIKSPEQSEAAGAMARPADIEFLPDSGDTIKSLPPINKGDQAAVARLFKDMVIKGDVAPIADTTKMNDGVLGKETRKAFEAIKDYYKRKNPQNARMTDQEVINAAKSPASQIG